MAEWWKHLWRSLSDLFQKPQQSPDKQHPLLCPHFLSQLPQCGELSVWGGINPYWWLPEGSCGCWSQVAAVKFSSPLGVDLEGASTPLLKLSLSGAEWKIQPPAPLPYTFSPNWSQLTCLGSALAVGEPSKGCMNLSLLSTMCRLWAPSKLQSFLGSSSAQQAGPSILCLRESPTMMLHHFSQCCSVAQDLGWMQVLVLPLHLRCWPDLLSVAKSLQPLLSGVGPYFTAP